MTMTRALKEQEVADRLSLSIATLRAWRRRGQGPRFVKFGRAVRYMVGDVEQFVRASAVEPSNPRVKSSTSPEQTL